MKRLTFLVSLCLLAATMAAPAPAQIDSFFDVFFVELGGDVNNWNVVLEGGGSGFAGGEWFPYPGETAQVDPWGNVNPVPSWRNQWFYDGRFRPDRHKEIDLAFTYALRNPLQDGGTDIVINWATPQWSLDPANAGSPPVGFSQNQFIGRHTLSRQAWLQAGDQGVYQFSARYDMRDFGVPFNPEWISIDVTGYNVRLSSPLIPGSIIHYCIPEPATLGLVALSVAVMICRRNR